MAIGPRSVSTNEGTDDLSQGRNRASGTTKAEPYPVWSEQQLSIGTCVACAASGGEAFLRGGFTSCERFGSSLQRVVGRREIIEQGSLTLSKGQFFFP